MSRSKLHPLLGIELPTWTEETTPIRTGGSTGLVGTFGLTRSGGRKWHKGVDLLAVVGWPVFAMHDGQVLRAGLENPSDDKQGYGRRIWLRRDDRIRSVYAHLSDLYVSPGAHVKAGHLLGRVGRTGNLSVSTPTHLHLEVRAYNEPISPLAWLRGRIDHKGVTYVD